MPAPSDNVATLYEKQAAAWQESRAKDGLIERDWLVAFLNALPVEGRTILDIGCGTGVPIAQYLIENGCTVTGVDAAPTMIKHARQGFPNHQWQIADMRKLPPLGKFHGIIAWHSFFHLPPGDQRNMFEAFRSLAAPGAVLMFTSGTVEGEAIGSFAGCPLYHGSLSSEEYRGLLEANGFETLLHIEEDSRCGGATVWLSKRAA